MTDLLLPGFTRQPDFDQIIPPLPRCSHTNVLLPECGCATCCRELLAKHRPMEAQGATEVPDPGLDHDR